MRKTSKVVDLVEETSSKVEVWKMAETKVEMRVEATSETKLMRKTKTMLETKTMMERKTHVVRDSLD